MGENLRKIVVMSALLAGLLLLAAPGAASARGGSAAESGETSATCEDPLIENPFVFDGDLLDYVLAPGGSFEDSADGGWLLDGGAATVPGNDPFPIHPSGTDAMVMSLPSGSTATSNPMCVDITYPHFRLAVHQLPNDRGKYKGKLRVETMYPNSDNPTWRTSDVIKPSGGDWILSDFLELRPERGGSEPGARQVALRFIVKGNEGAFEIDDVYIDPRFRV